MPSWFYKIVPAITTPLALAALIVAALVGVVVHLINLIRASRPADRLRIINAVLHNIEIDSTSLNPEQKLELAKFQLDLRFRFRKILLFFFSLVVLALVSAFGISQVFSENHEMQIADAARLATTRPPPAAIQPQSPDVIVGSRSQKRGVKLPFTVRFISPTTLQDEDAGNEEVTASSSRDNMPTPVARSGKIFYVQIEESETVTIHVTASWGDQKTERTIVISGYIASQMPCDQRTFYLPERPFVVTPKLVAVAEQNLSDATHCPNIDKALVMWDAIGDSAKNDNGSSLPKYVKNIGDLIAYNKARGNYQACITLGYEQECEIGETEFKRLQRLSWGKVNGREKRTVVTDIRSLPLRIAYTKVQKFLATLDYLSAAHAAEELIKGFTKNSEYWEHIHISKSRLYADAAVSWLHYGDVLASSEPEAEEQRCTSYRKALLSAQQALWYNFRQEHVPVIETRLRGCVG